MLLVLLWSLLVPSGSWPGGSQVVPGGADSLDALRSFERHWEREHSFWNGAEEQFSRALEGAEAALRGSSPKRDEAAELLLKLTAEPDPGPKQHRGGPSPADLGRVRRGARALLVRALAGEGGNDLLLWITQEVVVRPARELSLRLAAVDLLAPRRQVALKQALLTVGRDPADPLWPRAMDELVTWPDAAVDNLLVGLLGKTVPSEAARHPYTLLLRRIQENRSSLAPRSADRLSQRLRVSLLSTDWRDASRAIELAQGLAPERGVPLLLEALSAWTRREERGHGSRRILDDVLRELRRISGRSIGRDPRNWATWWAAVRQGRTTLGEPLEAGAQTARTRASFFGLQPVSDQVTFVIDRSGSMSDEWGTTGHSRYEEAVDQMLRFLQASGPSTRFNVVLFSDTPLLSSRELVPATAKNLERARESLLRRTPDGGTYLRPAVELALGLGEKESFDPQQVEADTLIVLCDGVTEEGKGWVAPLLPRIRDLMRVRIHCVFLGTHSDGTLRALAEGTGGDLIQVGG